MNAEIRSSEECRETIAQWISSTFNVNLTVHMKMPEIRQELKIAESKLAREYVKKTFIESSVGSSSFLQEQKSISL